MPNESENYQAQPAITKAGIAAMGALSGEGTVGLKFTHMGVSPKSFDPTGEETELKEERSPRYEIADSRWMEGNRLHLTASIEDIERFDVGSIGLYAGDTLFAVQSKAGELISTKLEHEDLLLSFDLIVSADLKTKITVEGNGERLNLSVAGELSKITEMIMNLEAERLSDKKEIEELKTKVALLEGRA